MCTFNSKYSDTAKTKLREVSIIKCDVSTCALAISKTQKADYDIQKEMVVLDWSQCNYMKDKY